MGRTSTTISQPQPALSNVERWFGIVTPKRQPEDFKEARAEFEQAVAEEVTGESELRCVSDDLSMYPEQFE